MKIYLEIKDIEVLWTTTDEKWYTMWEELMTISSGSMAVSLIFPLVQLLLHPRNSNPAKAQSIHGMWLGMNASVEQQNIRL